MLLTKDECRNLAIIAALAAWPMFHLVLYVLFL